LHAILIYYLLLLLLFILKNSGTPARADGLKIFAPNQKYCQLQNDAGWSEGVNLHNRQIMALPKKKSYAT
jgi:GT2 family glycosyltransferase